MALSTAIIGYGATLSSSTTVGGTYTNLAEVCDIKREESVKAVDRTHLTSDGATREYMAGMIEPGQVTFTLNYTKAQKAAVKAALRAALFFKITTSDGSVDAFPGFYMNAGTAVPEDDRVTQDVTIKVSGQSTFTAG